MLLKSIVVSITFLAGFLLMSTYVLKKIQSKKIYCFFIELIYFMAYWIFVYNRIL